MDRNSAIGLTLIAALLLVYFYWFAPKPQPDAKKPATEQSAVTSKAGKSLADKTPAEDSTYAASLGDLGIVARGTASETTVETEDLRLVFNSRGGFLKEAELKKYKTYRQKPLLLITPDRSNFSLIANYNGKDVDLYSLYYKPEQSKNGDSTVVSFTADLGNGAMLKHVWMIPSKGYEIRYKIVKSGFDFTGDNLGFQWNELIQLTEKDPKDQRDYSTICYYTTSDGFDKITEASTDTDVITSPLKWASVKQKFFLSAIIGENTTFSGGEFTTFIDPSDTSYLKQARVKLNLPKASLAKGAALKFYIGPNNYNLIGDVAPEFSRNINLGWPPVGWINKFVIFPVFHFLTTIISNYGLIIIILVLLLKLVLAPLSYRSYLSMAKMKVLKPDLDEIKERVGEDMSKVQQEQLKLYQQVGVNPISGCVPVLLQMPILFAMFYLFPASIELRQQPFLWAEDLSTYDSLIKLPFMVPFLGNHISLFTLLMTMSTLIYTWQNNQLTSVTGPMKSMGYIMPVIFFFYLNKFSAGLTFYYFVSNLITFSQQAIIRRFVDENKIKALLEENRKKIAAGGGGKKSKFMSKLEDAMKASEEARRKAEEDRKKKKK
jgi:YidC/Oxa1 family membrane protein insertase